MTTPVLFFYPYFPKYRRRILTELSSSADMVVTTAAGTTGRASIAPLTKKEFPDLREMKEIRLGPVAFNPEILRAPTLREYKVVVVAPATLSFTVWAILISRKLTGKSTYLWGQCGRPGDRGIKRLAQEVMNRLATGLLVYGEMERNSACELGTPKNKVSIVHNANDHYPQIDDWSSKTFARMAQSRGIGIKHRDQEVRLLYIGRVTAAKRLDRLIESVDILRQKGYEVEATVIGDGDAYDSLREMASDRALPVYFTGELHSDEELQPYLDRATLIVAPNSIGLLAIDALNNGIPVIYPSVSKDNGPEHEALTPGLNSRTFDEPTGAAIASTIEEWLELSPHINIQRYEAAARKTSKQWRADYVADRIKDIILASVRSRSPLQQSDYRGSP